MNVVKLLFVLIAGVSVVGCASGGSRTDYYLAVQQAAQAQAAQSEARYRALATIANSGDPAAKAMATMAIALNEDKNIIPQYIESDALSWARVLATPVATLGGLWIQSDVAKNASNNARDIQMANFASNEAIQLGQQNMVTNLGSQWATGAAASSQQLVDLGIAGFGALNTAGEQTVNLGVAGLTTADSIAGAGFTANENIATVGFTAADSIATTGITTVGAVGVAGMTNIVDVSKWGMEGIWLTAQNGMNGMEALGTAGMTNLTTLGQSGFTALNTMSADYNTLVNNIDTTNAGVINDLNTTWSGALTDNNATWSGVLTDTNSTYSGIVTDNNDTLGSANTLLQETIDNLIANPVTNTVVCTTDASGVISCS